MIGFPPTFSLRSASRCLHRELCLDLGMSCSSQISETPQPTTSFAPPSSRILRTEPGSSPLLQLVNLTGLPELTSLLQAILERCSNSHISPTTRLCTAFPRLLNLLRSPAVVLLRRSYIMSKHSTLIKPPKSLPHHSAIENVLSLLHLTDIGPDIYTNARPLWHPPGARGIFGGAAIAQCLSAAQATIPPDFTVHSMHCYFVLAGNSEIPILYHVERVRDGKSFITRTVQARQRGACIFTTTLSFMKEGSGGRSTVEHAVRMPSGLTPPPDGDQEAISANGGDDRPFESVRCSVSQRGEPQDKRLRQWLRARGRISDCPPNVREVELEQGTRANRPGDNHQAHLSALAYMSDSYFIGTVARCHNLMRFANRGSIERTLRTFKGSDAERDQMRKYLEDIARDEAEENAEFGGVQSSGKQIGMMVSLDHTIFFHNPRAFRADEWMLAEMESPWAGDGRGLVLQRIWTKDGTLIATCTQEGVVRLAQERESKI